MEKKAHILCLVAEKTKGKKEGNIVLNFILDIFWLPKENKHTRRGSYIFPPSKQDRKKYANTHR